MDRHTHTHDRGGDIDAGCIHNYICFALRVADEKIRSDSIKFHVFAVKIDWFASSFAAVRWGLWIEKSKIEVDGKVAWMALQLCGRQQYWEHPGTLNHLNPLVSLVLGWETLLTFSLFCSSKYADLWHRESCNDWHVLVRSSWVSHQTHSNTPCYLGCYWEVAVKKWHLACLPLLLEWQIIMVSNMFSVYMMIQVTESMEFGFGTWTTIV